jgi:glutaminyl-tRNA synthetase
MDEVGGAKRDSMVELSMLEHFLREDLNKHALRFMAVLRPLRVVITNYPEGQVEELDAINNPEDAAAGTRKVPFSRVLYIEQDDFREDPPKKFYRLSPGREVRLRYAYFITCQEAVKNEQGEIVELRCAYDPATRGGNAPDGRTVKSTMHWVSAEHALAAQVRFYDNLFTIPVPDDTEEGKDIRDYLNPNALEVLKGCWVERALGRLPVGVTCQFERQGYFCLDNVDSRPGALVFNRAVTLRDTWAKIEKKMQAGDA